MPSESKTEHVCKRCGCAKWKECRHPWYVDFQDRRKGRYRANLDKLIGLHAVDFVEAKKEARRAIDAWLDGNSAADLLLDDRPTLATLLAEYRKRADAAPSEVHQVGPITKTIVNGRPFGDWPADEITRSMLEAFRTKRKRVAGNRNLALLRAMFNWAVLRDPALLAATPWKVGNVAAVKLGREEARTRRLEPGEDEQLAMHAGRLGDLITAALETGCRQGELLSLQWRQISKREIFLPAGKTKAKKTRRVPVSSVLRAVLDARRLDPAGETFPPSAFVFGDAVGGRAANIREAWAKTVLRAHGIQPELKQNGRLTLECREQLKAIDLHFHDLRREAGSRWMDAGVPLSTIQKWLGHANIAQTSTYLAATGGGDADAMQTFERRLGRVVTQSDAFSSSGLESRSGSDGRQSGNIRLIENAESPMTSLKAVS